MTNGKHECWMTGFTASGRKVSFTLSSDDAKELVNFALQFDAYLVKSGISVREPGLDEGEQSETFHFIVRRAKWNDDNTETPIIDLYIDHDKMRFSLLKVYLNTPDDVEAFQQATGLQLGALPLYDGQAAIERGKDTRIDGKYMIRLQRPVTVVWKLNPAYEDGGKKAKRLFVRWDVPVSQNAGNSAQERQGATQVTTPVLSAQAMPPKSPENGSEGKVVTVEITGFTCGTRQGGQGVYYNLHNAINAPTYAFSRHDFGVPWFTEDEMAGWETPGLTVTFDDPLPVNFEWNIKDGARFLNAKRHVDGIPF